MPSRQRKLSPSRGYRRNLERYYAQLKFLKVHDENLFSTDDSLERELRKLLKSHRPEKEERFVLLAQRMGQIH